MKEIKGKNAVALVFTDNIDTKAVEQIQQMCDQDFAEEYTSSMNGIYTTSVYVI